MIIVNYRVKIEIRKFVYRMNDSIRVQTSCYRVQIGVCLESVRLVDGVF